VTLELVLELSTAGVNWIHLAVYRESQMAQLHRYIFHNLNRAAGLYNGLYCIDPIEPFSVAVV